MQPRLYFAYGSNMGKARMAARCPGSNRLGAATLPGYRWIIAADGYANVVQSPPDNVEGVLFSLTASDEARLDICEDVRSGCYNKQVLAVQHAGATVAALVYLNTQTTTGIAAPEYLEPLRRAVFTDAGLSKTYLARHILPFIQP